MSDINSGLPIRSQIPSQANYDDIIIKLGDASSSNQLASVDANGSQQTKIADASGSVITSTNNGGKQSLDVNVTSTIQVGQVDKSAFIYGTTSETPVGGVYQDASPSLVAGTTGAVRLTQNRAFHVNLRDAAGNQLGDSNADGLWIKPGDGTNAQAYTAAGAAKVDGSAVTQPVSGTVSASNFPSTVDTNYGTVGANTIRTASQIGNATGAADFNFGSASAQTLRVAALVGNATGSADFNAGATGAQTLRVSANQGDPGTAANGWFVKITDGTNTQSVTAGGAAHTTVDNLPTTVDTNYGTVGANTLRSAAQIGNATGAADFNNGATGAQTLRVAANLAVAGANVSSTNPVPVSFSSAPLGTPVNNYNTAAAVAAGATSNHDYSITAAKTFQGKKIWASASGLMKIEVQVSPDGSAFSTLWVGFNSTADSNITIDMDEMVFLESGAGSKIRVIRTNMDKKSMDVYSTISGTEV